MPRISSELIHVQENFFAGLRIIKKPVDVNSNNLISKLINCFVIYWKTFVSFLLIPHWKRGSGQGIACASTPMTPSLQLVHWTLRWQRDTSKEPSVGWSTGATTERWRSTPRRLQVFCLPVEDTCCSTKTSSGRPLKYLEVTLEHTDLVPARHAVVSKGKMTPT